MIPVFVTTAVIEFFFKHGKTLIIVIAAVVFFFTVRSIVLHEIAQWKAGIVLETETRKDAEWQEKLDAERNALLEAMENVRKKNKALEKSKPRNKSDTIKLLRDHKLNKAA